MIVAELAAALGWDIDFDTIAKYQSALNKTKEQTEELAAQAKILAALNNVHGDSAKALAMISLPEGSKAPSKGAERWARGLAMVNDALGIATKGYRILSSGANTLKGLVTATADVAGHLDDMAQKTGVGAEALQELGYAAKQNGSDLNGIGTGLKFLAKNADAAKGGSKEAAAAFRAAGVDVKGLLNGSVPLDGALGQIADRFAKMPDGPKKTALAMKLFGKSGVDLIPTLNNGAAGIAQLRQEARDTGAVMSAESVKGMADFGDSTDAMRMQIAGFRNEAVANLLPALRELVESTRAWMLANRADIITALTGAGRALIFVLQVLSVALRAVVAVIAFFTRHTKLLAVLLAALGAAFLYMGAQAAIGWLLALGPIGLIIAAIAAVVATVYVFRAQIWSALKRVAGFFVWLWGLAKKYWYLLLGPLTPIILAIMGAIALVKRFGDDVLNAFRRIGALLSTVASAIGRGFSAAASVARAVFNGVLDYYRAQVNAVIALVEYAIAYAQRMRSKLGWLLGPIGNFVAGKVLGSSSDSSPMSVMPKAAFGIPDWAQQRDSVSVNGASTTININGAGDPQGVADAVDQKLSSFWDRQLRNAAVGTGVA